MSKKQMKSSMKQGSRYERPSDYNNYLPSRGNNVGFSDSHSTYIDEYSRDPSYPREIQANTWGRPDLFNAADEYFQETRFGKEIDPSNPGLRWMPKTNYQSYNNDLPTEQKGTIMTIHDYNVVDEEPAKYSRHGYRIPDKTTRMAQRRLERGFSNEFEPHDRFYSEFGGKKRKRTIKRRKNSSKRGKRRQTRHCKK
jgi:hypothetical protein